MADLVMPPIKRPGRFFLWHEVTVTKTGRPNVLDRPAMAHAIALSVAVLDPYRERIGAPWRPSSWFRSWEVAIAVYTAQGLTREEAEQRARRSAHGEARAADGKGDGVDKWDALRVAHGMIRDGFPIDQAIAYEGTEHLHLGIARTTRRPRGHVLVSTAEGLVTAEAYGFPWASR